MIPLLLTASGFLNFLFYIYAIGFVIALGLEQVLKFRPLSVDASMNERNNFIVQSNRRYLWRQKIYRRRATSSLGSEYKLVRM